MTEPIEKICEKLTSQDRIGEVAHHWFSIYDLDYKYCQLLIQSSENAEKAKAWDELKVELKQLIKLPPSQLYEKLSELLEKLS
jgi:hypothetical protein